MIPSGPDSASTTDPSVRTAMRGRQLTGRVRSLLLPRSAVPKVRPGLQAARPRGRRHMRTGHRWRHRYVQRERPSDGSARSFSRACSSWRCLRRTEPRRPAVSIPARTRRAKSVPASGAWTASAPARSVVPRVPVVRPRYPRIRSTRSRQGRRSHRAERRPESVTRSPATILRPCPRRSTDGPSRRRPVGPPRPHVPARPGAGDDSVPLALFAGTVSRQPLLSDRLP